MELVLSLFPGIGLLDMAFEEEGFCIVRGPDLLWGGDVRRFHPPAARFDGIIGGPPCQAFSALRHLVKANGFETAPNLIPEYERCIAEAQPTWFLMENVPDAPQPSVAGYRVTSEFVRDVWVGGQTSRLRRFSFGTRDGRRLTVETLALHSVDMEPAVCGGARAIPVVIGRSGKRKDRKEVAGVKNPGPNGNRLELVEMLRRQGAPADLFSHSAFTVTAQRQMIGNGVPLPMGRAVARAVKAAMQIQERAA